MELSSLSYASTVPRVTNPHFELHTTFVMPAGREADGAVGAVWRAAGATWSTSPQFLVSLR
jgi:hypothetical protein